MSDPLGLSIGTTNLVAAHVGNQPVIRRSVVTLFGHAAPEVGMPSAKTDGIVLSGFVERVGDPVPLVAPDGSSHHADQLLVDALQAMVDARRPAVATDRDRRSGALGNIDTVVAAQRNACRAEPGAQRHARPADLRCRRRR